MATMTMSAAPSPFNRAAVRPHVSSPLAGGPRPAAARKISTGPVAFPVSRPLRPFPSIANSFAATGAPRGAGNKKPVKIIEPPANFGNVFVLNLSQGELSRQD